MTSYTITLPNEKEKTYRYITLIILIINCLVFGLVFFKTEDDRMKNIYLMGAMISITSLILFLINFFTRKLKSYKPGISFIILGITWFILGNYLFGISVVFFAFIGFYAKKKLEVLFTADGITYPSFPEKRYLWSELNNVVLKDQVLTIDLKNNKLIQLVIDKDSACRIDEKEFNEFCNFTQRSKEAKTQI